ncbi:MarR family transcriptional regulator [Treponema porcinum]|uniref:MarR family winged helix-turn-helix transcriptional regulator n=1 Tax=Treponema porcinum TaxID=261392 RepID=UPI002A81E6D0|nr:MarR family transcriptional regulator [Treponema porcinum]MDY4468109.1 MarR family transcriptional regulator [Treponema porcinum]
MSAPLLLKNINDKLERLANAQFKSIRLTFSQVRVMSFIYRKENFTTTQKDLEIFLDVSHPTINGILKRLEEKKFITTEMTKKDGHLSKTVRLTKKGENVLIESEKEKNLHEEALPAYLTKDERNKLIELLLKVQKSASEMEE